MISNNTEHQIIEYQSINFFLKIYFWCFLVTQKLENCSYEKCMPEYWLVYWGQIQSIFGRIIFIKETFAKLYKCSAKFLPKATWPLRSGVNFFCLFLSIRNVEKIRFATFKTQKRDKFFWKMLYSFLNCFSFCWNFIFL